MLNNNSKFRKIKSKNYGQVIEVTTTTRYYWNEDGSFDGIEFDVEGISNYQKDLLRSILETLTIQANNNRIATYMWENHKDELLNYLKEIEAKEIGVPQSFIDAFSLDMDGDNS